MQILENWSLDILGVLLNTKKISQVDISLKWAKK